jgi:CRISPR system Cascade subunit CasB
MDSVNVKPNDFPADEIYKWWREMQLDQEEEGRRNFRGDLAELRRCKNLAEVLLAPRFQPLRWKLQKAGYAYMPACAAVAGILAHVEINDAKYSFGEWLGLPKAEGLTTPKLSELRFRRLVQAKAHDELFIDLIRVLPLAADTAPVKQLARDVYSWNDYTRRNWTFAYYDAQAGEEKT